jgi:hypothetical protein
MHRMPAPAQDGVSMKCPGITVHCPGCGGGKLTAAIGTLAAVAVMAYAAWEILAALIWVIAAVIAAAVVIGIPVLVVIARRMNRPVYRPQPQPVYRARPAVPIAAGPSLRELEDRLRAAEIEARAAVLAASILAQQARPLPLSVSYSDTERMICLDR